MQTPETSTPLPVPSGAPDPSTNDTPISDVMTELTDAERKVYADAQAADDAAAKAAEPAPAVAADASKPEDAAAAAAVATPAAEPVVAPMGYEAPIIPNLVDPAADAPDFEAQLKTIDDQRAALDKRYEDGEVELPEFRRQDRALTAAESRVIGQQAEHNALVKSQTAFAAAAQQEAARTWETTYRGFLAQPESKAIVQDGLRFNAFQAAIHQVESSYEESKKPAPNHLQLLVEARNLFNTTFGITAAPPADAKPPERRAPSMADVPKTVGALPVAGSEGTKSSVDTLYELDINKLEDTLATMDSGKVDELLRQTPGSDYRGNLAA
ncbi:hypothetical protein [Dokdonella soli]|uniref:Scaffolding protein n=1 Tax=Dokdonella soli TaxID=529810 RepID=A0ABN1IU86_9GAMM